MKDGHLKVASLVEDERRRAKLQTTIDTDDRIPTLAKTIIFLAPGPTTLKEFLA
jgi:hypothetical protein